MIIRQPWAVEALAEHAAYIMRESPAAGERFIRAAERTLLQLEGMPRMGRAWEWSPPGLKGTRFWPVHGFPRHLVFYRPVRGGIEVLDVVHGAQDIPRRLQRG